MVLMEAPSEDQVETLIHAAVRAPSVHNTQPWSWRYSGGVVSLHADHSRQIRHQDSETRDLIISCGAALHHFRVAAQHEGWKTVVRRVPDRGRDNLLAELRLEPAGGRPPKVADDLYAAIFTRRSDRRHHSAPPVSLSYLDYLTVSAARQGASAVSLEGHHAQQQLSDMLLFARVIQDSNEAGLAEMARWMEDNPHDGVPPANRLRTSGALATQLAPVTRFPSGALADLPQRQHEPQRNWIAIGTSSDDPLSRLRAGEALSALLLQGTADGLAVLPLSQAVEVDQTRGHLEERLFGGSLCLQIVVQVSRPDPDADPIPQTPRRPVHEVFSIGC